MEISNEKIKAYALKNAIHYNGRANQGAVISGLFAEGLKKENVNEFSGRTFDEVRGEDSLWLC